MPALPPSEKELPDDVVISERSFYFRGDGGEVLRITPENVWQELKNRSPRALSYLINTYTDVVSSVVSRILYGVGTREDVEECVSDVFIVAWQRAGEYNNTRGTGRQWLLLLAKYQALTRRRHIIRKTVSIRQERQATSDPVVDQVLSRERQEVLVRCIEQLPPTIRAVVVRRYLLNMTIPHIAHELGLTRSQVDNRLSRGRQRLKEQWRW